LKGATISESRLGMSNRKRIAADATDIIKDATFSENTKENTCEALIKASKKELDADENRLPRTPVQACAEENGIDFYGHFMENLMHENVTNLTLFLGMCETWLSYMIETYGIEAVDMGMRKFYNLNRKKIKKEVL
jgi:hypothetical protein